MNTWDKIYKEFIDSGTVGSSWPFWLERNYEVPKKKKK